MGARVVLITVVRLVLPERLPCQWNCGILSHFERRPCCVEALF